MIKKLIFLFSFLFTLNIFALVEYDYVADKETLKKNILLKIIKDHLIFEGVIESDTNV